MVTIIALSITYIIGVNICFWMLLTEHKADGLTYTHGDRIICLLFSMLSWFVIIQRLISAWIEKIGDTGYWEKSIIEDDPVQILKSSNGQHKVTAK